MAKQPSVPLDQVKPKEMYWPYNEMANEYHDQPLLGRRAVVFVRTRNICRNCHWVIHTIAQFARWTPPKTKKPKPEGESCGTT